MRSGITFVMIGFFGLVATHNVFAQTGEVCADECSTLKSNYLQWLKDNPVAGTGIQLETGAARTSSITKSPKTGLNEIFDPSISKNLNVRSQEIRRSFEAINNSRKLITRGLTILE